MVSEITTLKHELRNNSVEAAALISESFLSSAKSSEVFSCSWDNISIQLEYDFSEWLAVCGDFKESSWVVAHLKICLLIFII